MAAVNCKHSAGGAGIQCSLHHKMFFGSTMPLCIAASDRECPDIAPAKGNNGAAPVAAVLRVRAMPAPPPKRRM
jgi:hypothetical protein